jgi:16S rRNA (guanine527-N7)-methyltransferase
MNPARIAELLAPFLETAPLPIPDLCHSEPASAGEEPAVLSSAQLQCISMYIDLLLRWNARINLTAIRDPEEIVTRHFGESFFAARHLFERGHREGHGLSRADGLPRGERALAPEATAVVDLGSGAGFPGIPIKIWAPYASLTLVESNHKKAVFLGEVVRALTLTNVDIRNVRAGTLPPASFAVVTLRGVERFHSILPTAASLVAPGGRLVLLIGSAQFSAARSALPHLAWEEPQLVPLSRARVVAIGHRTGLGSC